MYASRMRRSGFSLLAFAALIALPTYAQEAHADEGASTQAKTSTKAPESEPPLRLRWGIALGLGAWLPYGADREQSGAPEAEFDPAMTLNVEALSLDIGSYVEIVPFFRTTLVGGLNSSLFRQVIEEQSQTQVAGLDHHLHQMGLGLRIYPLQWKGLRPFVSVYGSYVVTNVRYNDPNAITLPTMTSSRAFSSPKLRHTHEGAGLTLGLGLRYDLKVRTFGSTSLVPLILEAQWTKHFWTDLDRSAVTANSPWLAPHPMKLDAIQLVLSVGFKP